MSQEIEVPLLGYPCRPGTKITARFGQKGTAWVGGIHKGVDIDDEMRAPIYACYDGVVEHVGRAPADRPRNAAWGNYIVIAHFHNGLFFKTYYCHLSEIYVKPGDQVNIGHQIAAMGNSGNVRPSNPASDGSHLCNGLFVKRGPSFWQWEEPRYVNASGVRT